MLLRLQKKKNTIGAYSASMIVPTNSHMYIPVTFPLQYVILVHVLFCSKRNLPLYGGATHLPFSRPFEHCATAPSIPVLARSLAEARITSAIGNDKWDVFTGNRKLRNGLTSKLLLVGDWSSTCFRQNLIVYPLHTLVKLWELSSPWLVVSLTGTFSLWEGGQSAKQRRGAYDDEAYIYRHTISVR